MPFDHCGICSDLDRNSPEVLLLTHHTIVPPGYHGFLTCTFVNFSNRDIVLRPVEPIARVVFLRLDQPAVEPGKVVEPDQYDKDMSTLALNAPSTFLAIA